MDVSSNKSSFAFMLVGLASLVASAVISTMNSAGADPEPAPPPPAPVECTPSTSTMTMTATYTPPPPPTYTPRTLPPYPGTH